MLVFRIVRSIHLSLIICIPYFRKVTKKESYAQRKRKEYYEKEKKEKLALEVSQVLEEGNIYSKFFFSSIE